MLDWNNIRSVFLDMDGTLLDLYFDNHFWREHVPLRYAEYHDIEIEAARQELFPRFAAVEGTIEWYCVDYWSQELGMDIAELKREVDHLIQVHPHVIEFLSACREQGKRVVLVTNAHAKSLDIKMNKTRLAGQFDAIICAHDLGMPKEEHSFWEKLQQVEPYDPDATLFVDDSLPVLRSAKRYGIAHLLAIHKPDTRAPAKDVAEFSAIHGFDDIMPVK